VSYWQPFTWLQIDGPGPAGITDDEDLIGLAANNLYEAWVFSVPYMRKPGHHLSIRRFDKNAARDWRHLQWVKNEICGPEREAVEIFPAESRLMDAANQYHLWVLPAGYRIPFGSHTRAVRESDDETTALLGARQRKWDIDPDYYIGRKGLLERIPKAS